MSVQPRTRAMETSMFIKHLKSQYLVYFLISFGIGGKHLIKSFQGPEVVLSVSVNLATMFTLAFVLCLLGFCCRMVWRLLGPKLRSRPGRFSSESPMRWFLTKDALICYLLTFLVARYTDNSWVMATYLVLSAGIYCLYSDWRDKKSRKSSED